ncbi:MAG TPA: hypothetical protein VGL77_10635 [Armatimonadota bacterium]|jgi:hypothetical protein
MDGLFAEDGWTAVPLLSAGSPIRRINIRNIMGTYRYNVVAFTNHGVHPGEASTFEDITLRDIHCAKSRRGLTDLPPAGPIWSGFSPIWIDRPAVVRHLHMEGYTRTEAQQACDGISIESGATVDGLLLRDCHVVNRTPGPIVLLRNQGAISNLALENVSQSSALGMLLHNSGTITDYRSSNLTGKHLEKLTEGV